MPSPRSIVHPRQLLIILATLALAFAMTVVGSTVANADGSACNTTAGTSGTCSSTQPQSTADQNNTGANDTSSSNQYQSTRDGSASANGSDTGEQTGQPCAGCVGKADNKNPDGQAFNGGDANNGYECDGNNGVAKSNPAHTGCSATAEQSTTGSTGSTSNTNSNSTGNDNANDNATTNGTLSNSGSVGAATTAQQSAQVLGESQTAAAAPVASPAATTSGSSSTAPAEVLGETITRSPQAAAAALARTGSNPLALTVLALILLGGGSAVLALRRRQVLQATPSPSGSSSGR